MAGVLQTPVIAATRLPRCNQNFFQSQGNLGKDLLFFVYTKEKYLTIYFQETKSFNMVENLQIFQRLIAVCLLW